MQRTVPEFLFQSDMIIPAGRAEYAPHPAAANSGTVPPAQWPQNNASALAIFHVTLSPHSIFWNSPSLQPAVILDWPDRHGTPLCKQEELGLPGLQPHTPPPSSLQWIRMQILRHLSWLKCHRNCFLIIFQGVF